MSFKVVLKASNGVKGLLTREGMLASRTMDDVYMLDTSDAYEILLPMALDDGSMNFLVTLMNEMGAAPPETELPATQKQFFLAGLTSHPEEMGRCLQALVFLDSPLAGALEEIAREAFSAVTISEMIECVAAS